MHRFLLALLPALTRGPVVLCTVVATKGSTPRVAGARMAVNATGIVAGTIGGGMTEGRVLDLAAETLRDGRPRQVDADLRGKPGEIRDGICGGTMTLWLVRLSEENAGPMLRQALAALEAGRKFPLRTTQDPAQPLVPDTAGGGFPETWEPDPILLVVGAGHIGRSLAALAVGLGYRVTVQDERAEWRDASAFPPGCVLEASPEGAAARLGHWEGGRFVVLVTRGFAQDIEALRVLAPLPGLTYVGLLGSRKRVRTVLAAHAASGATAFPEGVLHAPVGLEIAAETPEEIAVSIAAEMTRVRRRGARP